MGSLEVLLNWLLPGIVLEVEEALAIPCEGDYRRGFLCGMIPADGASPRVRMSCATPLPDIPCWRGCHCRRALFFLRWQHFGACSSYIMLHP